MVWVSASHHKGIQEEMNQKNKWHSPSPLFYTIAITLRTDQLTGWYVRTTWAGVSFPKMVKNDAIYVSAAMPFRTTLLHIIKYYTLEEHKKIRVC